MVITGERLKEISTQPQTRSLTLELRDYNPDSREMTFSFSSEAPVERWWGNEVLSHELDAADLQRLNNGAAFLWNHNRDAILGVVKSANIGQDRRGHCTVRWSQEEEAQKYKRQVDDGILSNVSFAYSIDEVKEVGDNFIVTKWSPLEVSLVSIPADPTVGIGRELSDKNLRQPSNHTDQSLEQTDNSKKAAVNFQALPSGAYQSILEAKKKEEKIMPPEAEININNVRAEARTQERDRINSIAALGKRHNLPELAEQLIEKGTALADARSAFLDRIENRQQEPVAQPVNPLGLSEKEQKNYSIIRAVQAFIEKDWSKAGFELECSREIEKRSGRSASGFFVPVRDLKVNQSAVQNARSSMGQRAPYATTNPAAAGVLVETQLDSANFIDILRNRPLIMQLGTRMITGLQGNLDIPRRTGTSTAYWVAEGSGPAESEGAFDLIQFRPKTLGVLTAMTRLMMMQSTPDIEMLVRDDLAQVIGLEIDRVCIDGSGVAGQPRGILQTPGIGSVALGINGGSITMDAIIDLETIVAIANADVGSLNYLTNSKVVGALKKLKTTSNEYLWTGSGAGLSPGTPGSINGYSVGRTNQVPANKSKGTGTNLSSILYGNFRDLYVAEWGILDLLPNPYGAGYAAGNVEIRALQTLDVQVARASSFSACTDIAA